MRDNIDRFQSRGKILFGWSAHSSEKSLDYAHLTHTSAGNVTQNLHGLRLIVADRNAALPAAFITAFRNRPLF